MGHRQFLPPVRPGRHIPSQQLLHETSLFCFVLPLIVFAYFHSSRDLWHLLATVLQTPHSFPTVHCGLGSTKMVRGTCTARCESIAVANTLLRCRVSRHGRRIKPRRPHRREVEVALVVLQISRRRHSIQQKRRKLGFLTLH